MLDDKIKWLFSFNADLDFNAQSWSNEIIQTQSFGMGIKQQKQSLFTSSEMFLLFCPVLVW